MRKRKASYITRITKKSNTKVDEQNEIPEKELTVEPSEEWVPQSSLEDDSDTSGQSEEKPEEDPIEELEEELEEDPIEELEEGLEEDPIEELEEEIDEEVEEEPPIEEPEEEPEEAPIKELEEAPIEELEEEPEEAPCEEPEKALCEELEEPEEAPFEELDEEPEEAPFEELEEESEEAPSEELDDEPEEAPCEELDEEPEAAPSEELEEEPKEEPSKELEEDPEEESSEETNEELEEEPAEEPTECSSQSISNHNNDEIDADEDGYESESVLNNSNEKKRSLDATVGESAALQLIQSQKKCRQEESSKPGSDFGSVVGNLHIKIEVSKTADGKRVSEQQECMGSSEKRRRSRWDTQPTVDGETDEVDRNSKRRKTKWDGDNSQLKMLGPIQLPDFMKGFVVGSDLDPQIQELNLKLLGINSKLKSSELHDDRPEEERSPSPPPLYNNLGIRINTREVWFREKLILERQDIISKLIQKNPTFKCPTDYKPPKLLKKLYIPVKEYPDYNFIGLILGPRGNTQKRMEKETGAKILLRGKGSRQQQIPDPSDNEDLHVLIEASNQKSLDAAAGMVEKLLIPVQVGMSDLKLAQLQELAKLNGSYRDENKCSVCSEQGHKHYACPQLQSTFKIVHSCDSCGGNNHPGANCPLTAPSPHATNSLQGSSSGLGLGSTPKTQNEHKDTSNANLYVGYIPQAADDNWLREVFEAFGKLTAVKVIKDRTTGLSKGYGFVKFENPTDAAVAVTHMNGYKTDGKFMAVRVAGRTPVSGSSVLSNLPMYPGPAAAVSPAVPSQTAWPGPPGSMLPEPQDPFPKSEGSGFPPPSSIYTGHSSFLSKSDTFGGFCDGSGHFSPLSSVSSLPDSMSASSLNTSFKHSSQTQFFSPVSLALFPGDPDYPGSSEFRSYFATPMVKPSPPYHFATPMVKRSPPYHFGQPPESELRPCSWSTTHLP